MTDIECKNVFLNEKGKQKPINLIANYLETQPQMKEYVYGRYADSESLKETVYRIINGIEKKPCCRCGTNIKYNKTSNRFPKYCSAKCQNSDPEKLSKDKKTKLEKYGSETYNNIGKMKETCLRKYGTDSYTKTKEFLEKVQVHNIQNYGVPWLMQRKEIQMKAKETKRIKYGDENYNNREKSETTTLKRYGVRNTKQWEGAKEKEKQTCLEKYGVSSYSKTKECTDKKRRTFLKNWGAENNTKSERWKEKWYANKEWVKNRNEKIYNTMAKNGSFNNSRAEKIILDFLKENYPDVIHQYKDERYPFKCDFYIPSKDLFIEYNGFWFHRDHYFDETNEDDIKLVNNWKNKKTKFYNNAIETWTIRDVEKIKKVKENNLNFIPLWHGAYTDLQKIKKMVDEF